MRAVFFGTPGFAVPCLRMLHRQGWLAGVVTAPDKPGGRGLQLQASAVKQEALAMDVPILQPEKLRDDAFLAQLAHFQADVFVVVAFRMLPRQVWALPPMGTLNLHAGLLPSYRGAAPIHWVMINGERFTGLTTFLIDESIDTGGLLLQRRIEILPHWNAGHLHDALLEPGAELVHDTLLALQHGPLLPWPQPDAHNLPKAPKLSRADALLNWHQSSNRLHQRVRGLAPRPGAFSLLEGQVFKILESRIVDFEPDLGLPPGHLHRPEAHRLWVATADGFLELLQVQLEGKRAMSTAEFLRGNPKLPAFFNHEGANA